MSKDAEARLVMAEGLLRDVVNDPENGLSAHDDIALRKVCYDLSEILAK